jgi:hypothetical protein
MKSRPWDFTQVPGFLGLPNRVVSFPRPTHKKLAASRRKVRTYEPLSAIRVFALTHSRRIVCNDSVVDEL